MSSNSKGPGVRRFWQQSWLTARIRGCEGTLSKSTLMKPLSVGWTRFGRQRRRKNSQCQGNACGLRDAQDTGNRSGERGNLGYPYSVLPEQDVGLTTTALSTLGSKEREVGNCCIQRLSINLEADRVRVANVRTPGLWLATLTEISTESTDIRLVATDPSVALVGSAARNSALRGWSEVPLLRTREQFPS